MNYFILGKKAKSVVENGFLLFSPFRDKKKAENIFSAFLVFIRIN